MKPRFFVETPIEADVAKLVEHEAHHLLHVLRLGEGAEVTLFDGSGAEFDAQVAKTSRSEVELAVLARHDIDRELATRITLAVALPKGDRQRWMVEKATELGVRRLVPLETEHGVAQPVAKALARLKRSVVEASKQCRRNRLMEIAEPAKFADFIASAPAQAVRYIAHPGGELQPTDLGTGSADQVFLAVGPEGGFTEDEVAAACSAGWKTVDLGPRILRIETAATVLTVLASQLQ